jgi:hypothetical protein
VFSWDEAGGYCVAADTWSGLFVLGVHDPARPAIVAHAQLPKYARYDTPDPVGGRTLALSRRHERVWCEVVRVVDIADFVRPLLAQIPTPIALRFPPWGINPAFAASSVMYGEAIGCFRCGAGGLVPSPFAPGTAGVGEAPS